MNIVPLLCQKFLPKNVFSKNSYFFSYYSLELNHKSHAKSDDTLAKEERALKKLSNVFFYSPEALLIPKVLTSLAKNVEIGTIWIWPLMTSGEMNFDLTYKLATVGSLFIYLFIYLFIANLGEIHIRAFHHKYHLSWTGCSGWNLARWVTRWVPNAKCKKKTWEYIEFYFTEAIRQLRLKLTNLTLPYTIGNLERHSPVGPALVELVTCGQVWSQDGISYIRLAQWWSSLDLVLARTFCWAVSCILFGVISGNVFLFHPRCG